jgi:hypothetical protein
MHRLAIPAAFALALPLLGCGSDAGPTTAGRTPPIATAGEVGPVIACDDLTAGAMLNAAPGSTVALGGTVTSPNGIRNVSVNGAAATLSDTKFSANITSRFGINFADIAATDTKGTTSTRTCSFLVANHWAAEDTLYGDTVDMKLTQGAIDDGDRTNVNSLADILYTLVNSPGLQGAALQTLLAGHLPQAVVPLACQQQVCTPPVGPVPGSCLCQISAGVDLLGLSLPGPQSVSMALVNGGINVAVTVPNLGLNLDVHGGLGSIPYDVRGWVTASSVHFSMTLDTSLTNGQLKMSLRPQSAAGSVGPVTTNFPGLDGWIIDNVVIPFAQGYIQNMVSTTVPNMVTPSALAGGMGSIFSGLIYSPFGTAKVPALTASASPIPVSFGYSVTSLSTTPSEMLIGVASKLSTPATQTLPSLGIAIPSETVLDDMNVTAPSTTGVAVHVGVLNQALYALWRGGMFDTTVTGADFGNGLLPPAMQAKLTSQLPPVANLIGNCVEFSLGGLQLTDPGIVGGQPFAVDVGARLTSTPSLDGKSLRFASVTVTELHFSTGNISLDPTTDEQLRSLLQNVVQQLTLHALNKALPSLPSPSLVLPLGVQAGMSVMHGLINPSLGYDANDFVLLGQFGPQ